MSKEAIAPDKHTDPKWSVIFSLYSWWESIDGRAFVISQRWNNLDNQVEYLELLEVGLEKLKVVPYETFYNEFKAGKLTRTSKNINAAMPPRPGPLLWPDR